MRELKEIVSGFGVSRKKERAREKSACLAKWEMRVVERPGFREWPDLMKWE